MKNVKNIGYRMANLSVRIRDVQTNMMVHLGMGDFVLNFAGEVFVVKRQLKNETKIGGRHFATLKIGQIKINVHR